MTENIDPMLKDPEDQGPGDLPATGAQLGHLQRLAHEAGRTVPEGLSKDQAERLVAELEGGDERIADQDQH